MMIVHRVFFEHGAVVDQAAVSLPLLLELVSGIVRTALAAGNKILACGNGGSAATAQHLVAELVGRFQRERRALAAIALTSDSAIVSAIANDYGYERVFARQVEALAGPGDVLIALSTSGNSPNVVEAARTARAMDCRVVALTGIDGGALAAHADTVLRAPSKVVARIQEIHDICIHVLAEAMEDDPTPAQRA
ncbi:MAG: SIS domain-containing protein [Rhodanobacteraceae bacterium]